METMDYQQTIQRRLNKVAADLDQAFINLEVQKIYLEVLTETKSEHRFFREALTKAAQRADYYERKISALTEEQQRLTYSASNGGHTQATPEAQ